METLFVQVERCDESGMVRVISRISDAPEEDKSILRPLDYRVFEETHIPSEYQHLAGALISLMFWHPLRMVRSVEIEALRDGDVCTATAQIETSDQKTYYRSGFGDRLIEALVELTLDIQQR
jgi:hypothetical protein